MLNTETSAEGLFVEINVRRKKWLIGFSYNPNKTFISAHLKEIGKNLDIYSSKYDNFILLGDLNSEPKEQSVKDFCQVYICKNIIKGNTCFKNSANPPCIDLFITNRPACFQGSMTIETGMSDFYKMCLSIMKVFYKKWPSNIARYRNYKNFNNEVFINDLNEYFTKNAEFLSFSSFKITINKTPICTSKKAVCKSKPSSVYE